MHMISRLNKLIISLILSLVLLPSGMNLANDNTFVFKDVPKGHWSEKYIYRLKFLGAAEGDGFNTFGFNRHISRAEFVTMLLKLTGQDMPDNTQTQTFDDVPGSSWYSPYIDRALKQGIIIKDDYPDNLFDPKGNITRQEIAIMSVRALKCQDIVSLCKNADPGFTDVAEYKDYIFIAKSYGIINGRTSTEFKPFEPAKRQEAAAMVARLIDAIYKKEPYPVTISNPIAGHKYRDIMPIEVAVNDALLPLIEKVDITMNDNKTVKTFTTSPFTGEIDISKLSPSYHFVKAVAYTKEGVKLESFPVSINLTNNDNDGLDRYRNALKDQIVESTMYLENKKALSNILIPSASGDRKLFISDSPEAIASGTGQMLFDSNKQDGNSRLLFYHENQLSNKIILGIEVENLGDNELILTEKAGYSSSSFGNSAGYFAQHFFFNVRNGEKDAYWEQNFQIRNKVHVVPPKSRLVIFEAALSPGKVGTYVGDFDIDASNSYIMRVAYTQYETLGPIQSAFTKSQLADPDTIHSRGVFGNADFDINIDTSLIDRNTCFQIGNDKKTYTQESSIHPEQIGYNQEGIVRNDGHYGEFFNVNIDNQQAEPLTVAIEFRGATKDYPSFPTFYGASGATYVMAPSKDTALYPGRQLIIEKTSEKQVKFTFCIPPGMNGPLYIYIIKDK